MAQVDSQDVDNVEPLNVGNMLSIRLVSVAFILQGMALCAVAQTSYDAFQVMAPELNGTARYIGMGGAMGAFGSDLSTISRNPAGIGTYVNSDMNISFAFNGSNTYIMNPGTVSVVNADDLPGSIAYSADGCRSGVKFSVEELGFVLALPTGGSSSLNYVNFAFAYHHDRNLDRTLLYFDDTRFPGYLAEFRDLRNALETRVNTFDFNISFNHNDRFYWGMTFETLSAYSNTSGHFYHYYPSGQYLLDEPIDITSVDRQNELRGNGFDFKLGFIVRPNAGKLRFGASMSIPTLYSMSETYIDYIYALDGEPYDGKKFLQDTWFKMGTPWVFNASLGYSTGRTAFGLEYDCNIADGSYMKINNYTLQSQCGSRDYRNYSAIRAGFETNISLISLRCGYNYTFPMFNDNGEKYMDDTEFNRKRMDIDYENIGNSHTFTVGIGYCSRIKDFGGQLYVDAAYAQNFTNSTLHLGEYPGTDPVADYRTSRGKFVLTLGMSF